jgi:hypothetical protein
MRIGLPEEDAGTLVVHTPPSDRNPAFVYLGTLAPGSRRAMYKSLDIIAKAVVPDADVATRSSDSRTSSRSSEGTR